MADGRLEDNELLEILRNDSEGESGAPFVALVTSTEQVMQLIQKGEEPKRIYTAIIEGSLSTAGGHGAAIYLPSDESSSTQICLYTEGDFTPESELGVSPENSQRIVSYRGGSNVMMNQYGSTLYYSCPVVNLGMNVGALVIVTDEELSPETLDTLLIFAHHTGIVFERQKLTGTVQHFLDRLQVLNQLNNLIASNANVAALVKSIARESAFRFVADFSVTMILNDDKSSLEILRGAAYGCAPNLIPPKITLNSGVLMQVMQLGGHMSIPNLRNYANHGLSFLEQLGVIAVDAHCLEVRGDSLGILIMGFKREQSISRQELSAFQEYCQGSAVALANAKTQERINAYSERLHELVETRTQELERQTMLAEEANNAKSQFLANMSHELRTPLTAIIGYSSVIKDGIFGTINERQMEGLVAITRSSEHLKNLIDDVLNLARVESGKENPEAQIVSLQDLLQQSYKLMMQSAIGKGLKLEQPKLQAIHENIGIHADPKHLQQIIINLISNAVKYTPRNGRVWITTEIVVDKVKISIHDSGVGIPPAKQASLFGRFERGDDSYSKSQEGTGIGLNLTKHLVEINGGRIGVESVQGEGSTFWIMMPLGEKDLQSSVVQEQSINGREVQLSGLTTLVVDDNRDTCDVLKTVLTAAGAVVRVANSVREGLELISESTPDIILTDLAMPVDSGLVLIQNIRTRATELANLPIIVLSACAFASDRDAAIGAGASTFIAKPFSPYEVLKTVRELTLSRALQSSFESQ